MHSVLSVLTSCACFAEAQLGLTSDDTLYSVPKAFFGYGMGNSLFFPLYLGATSLLDSRWPTSATVAENIKSFSPSVLFAVPTLYRKLLDEDLRPQDCTVRLAFSAGAPLSEQIREAWHTRFGFDLHDGIGTTELCHVFATTYPHAMRTGSVGRMVTGFRHCIVDECRAPVEAGKIGVLLVDTPCSSIGYWNNPAETAAKFKDGWWCTGDLFSEDQDGFLYFHGREDDRFKVFGRWLVPLEIERLLKNCFPEIDEAFVVPGRDVYGENRPVLFMRSSETDIGRMAMLTTTVISDSLESFKKPVLCLPLSEIPYTPSGKVNRRELSIRASAALAHVESKQQKLEV